MNKTLVYSSVILGSACLIALFARLMFPEILPVLDGMRIIFYLILAVTIIATLRNVIGLVTYGVFGPAIISLGLTRIGDIYWGLTALFSVIALGLIVRALLEPLKIQITHRMAIVVIAVSSTMGILKFIGFTIANDPLTYASFLPILISSWIVERFARHQKESGWKIASQRLAYTIIAILISFYLISEKMIINYFIYTPETWILPVAFNVLIGAKVRVRLSEFLRFKKLAKKRGWSGILTMNIRNRDLIGRCNPEKLYHRTLKQKGKETLRKAGIPVPKTLAVFKTYRDLKKLRKTLDSLPPEAGFVIKPSNSSGGRGILLIKRRSSDVFEGIDGKQLNLNDIKEHLEAVLDGEYSRGWDPDEALIEEALTPHPALERLSYVGLPDIRVIVFKGIPITAMVRLPTKKSNGKANLHRGAIGAGVDLTTGKIVNAVVAYRNIPITHHSDTGVKLIDKKVPFWEKILHMAVKSQKATGLGYVGVDVVIDKNRGPLVMEVNKRPGMEIQNANRKPLLERIEAVEVFLQKRGEVSVKEGIETMHQLESINWKYPSKDESTFMEDKK